MEIKTRGSHLIYKVKVTKSNKQKLTLTTKLPRLKMHIIKNEFRDDLLHQYLIPKPEWLVGWLTGWGLTALSTQFRSYRAFKVELLIEVYIAHKNRYVVLLSQSLNMVLKKLNIIKQKADMHQ